MGLMQKSSCQFCKNLVGLAQAQKTLGENTGGKYNRSLEMFVENMLNFYIYISALQKAPEDMNVRAADMWSFAILLWELVTREVPFAGLTPMEIGMKV